MKYSKLLYILAALLLASCSQDSYDAPDELPEMQFRAGVYTLSRSGIFNDNVYPVTTPLLLTAYHTDLLGNTQYYFKDMAFTYDNTKLLWKAEQWYWPMQGGIAFLSYWCPAITDAPVFDEFVDIDGIKKARMTVDATHLDGLTDFIYLNDNTTTCPQTSAIDLAFSHALAWISISIRAEVLEEGLTSLDVVKTNELIDHIKVNKIIIEDCARCGLATVVPGSSISWKPYDDRGSDEVSYVRDQIYYNDNPSAPDAAHYAWHECADGSKEEVTDFMRLSATEQKLGTYDPETGPYLGYGLLLLPQNKTSIAVDYTVINATDPTKELHKVERFVLRDNTDTWQAGCHYDYKIVFRNYDEIGTNFDVISTWAGVKGNVITGPKNQCFNGWGQMMFSVNNNYISIEQFHTGGSGKGDEMDYTEGPRIF